MHSELQLYKQIENCKNAKKCSKFQMHYTKFSIMKIMWNILLVYTIVCAENYYKHLDSFTYYKQMYCYIWLHSKSSNTVS